MNPTNLSRLLAARDANDIAAATMELHRERFDRLRDRHLNGTAPRAVSAYQLFQTPAHLAARMVELAGITPGEWVLEPSAGLGRIVDPLLAAGANVAAVEVSPDLSGELFTKYEGKPVALFQRDFLTVPHPREGNAGLIVKGLTGNVPPFLSACVMNPPFHMRSDIAHIHHALGFLRTGGRLVGLCLATHHRETAIRPLADHWEEIPAGTFRKEGTGVACYLFRIINNRNHENESHIPQIPA